MIFLIVIFNLLRCVRLEDNAFNNLFDPLNNYTDKKSLHFQLISDESVFQNEFIEDIMSEIFTDIADHDIMIHFDSITSDLINKIMEKNNHRDKHLFKFSSKNTNSRDDHRDCDHAPVAIMLNYDTTKGFIYPIIRRSTIHVVILTNASRFDKLYKNSLKTSDVIIFICHKHCGACKTAFTDEIGTLDPLFLKGSAFFKTVPIILVTEFLENRIRLYDVCYYCGLKANSIYLQYEVSFHRGTPPSEIDLGSEIARLLENKVWNFNGHTIKIAFISGGISFACLNPRNVSSHDGAMTISCENSFSLEGNFLEEMKNRMNFEYEMLTFEYKYGRIRETLINVVNKSRADISVGSITVTASRWEKADFSYTILEDQCRVVYNVQSTFLKEGIDIIF